MPLVRFDNARFLNHVDFSKASFGDSRLGDPKGPWFSRIVDFSDANFKRQTSFEGASFFGVPGFFNTELHQDTDFSGVEWNQSAADRVPADDAVQAWERLELIMSKLEKPFDRHRFFRFKMRAQRRAETESNRLKRFCLKGLNRLYECTSNYGWDVGRTIFTWFLHWGIAALILFINAMCHPDAQSCWEVGQAAVLTAFANAHAILALGSPGGHLAPHREFLTGMDTLSLMPWIGTLQAVLGPVFLFLLLLALRNRFRLG